MKSHEVSEEWRKTSLKKIVKIIMGQSPDSSTYNQDGKGLAFLQGNADFGATNPRSSVFCSSPKKIANKNNVLISVRAPVGDLNIADKDYCIGRGVAAFEAGKEIDSVFLYYALFLSRQYLFRVMQGTTFEAVNKTDLENITVSKPAAIESQRKIASILLTIEKAIEKTKALIEKSEKIKQGLMRDLLSPVKIPNNWKERRIAELSDIISGSTPKTSVSNYWNGSVVWVTPDDLSKNESIYMNSSSRKLSKKGLNNCSAHIIPKNSIVMSSRAPIGYLAIMKVDYSTNQGCKSFKLKDVCPEFIYYSLKYNMQNIRQMGEGTTFSEISKAQLEKINIVLPELKKEQERIASFLLKADDKIYLEQMCLEKLLKIKSGLMKDLLTGKVRIKVAA